MLSMYQIKFLQGFLKRISVLAACICLPLTSFANDEKHHSPIKVHGFISQGIIDVNGSNFVNDDGKTSLELTEIGINASYQVNADIRLAAQAVYLNGGNRYSEGARVDYLLMDWSIYNSERWQTNLYLGRIKNYHWLYSSTRDVPMTRPSIILPQSVYFDGTRDMSVGGDGFAIANKYNDGDLGELDFNISSSTQPISFDTTQIIMGHHSKGRLHHDEDLQASIYWRPSFSQWQFGIALTDAEFSYKQGNQDAFSDGILDLNRKYVNAEFQGETWGFSVELLEEKMTLNGILFPGFSRSSTGRGGFVQAHKQISADNRFLARYEHYFADKDDKHGKTLEQSSNGLIPHYFGFQYDFLIGFKHSFSSNLELQIEHHWIEGTARLTPLVIPDPTANSQKHWQITSAQLTYWF